MSKTIIHITDKIDNNGVIYRNGESTYFEGVDMKTSLDLLLQSGVLNDEDIIFVEEDGIYDLLIDLLEIEDAYYDKACEDMDPDYAYEEIEVKGEDEAE
jgi:hypothetical protein